MKRKHFDNVISSHQLKKLREKIPESKYEDIKENLLKDRNQEYSIETIKSVLNGERINDVVLIAALEISIKITQSNITKLRKLLYRYDYEHF